MKNYFLFIISIFFLSSCCQDHSDIIPGQDFIPDEILEKIIENGHPINDGFDPPTLEGCYLVSTLELVQSNFEDPLYPGYIFNDLTICFENYNSKNLTIDANYTQANTTGDGTGSFISGTGNEFTIYVKVVTTDTKGHEFLTTALYSGTLENDGIRNMFNSIFVVDDKGDPNGDYIENGQGRLIKDGDGFSPEI